MMKILCTICARGGSKGVKNKNIRELKGKPLIAYTIETAMKWGKFNDIVISTDSEVIKDIALEYGGLVPFMRPDYLATDNAGKVAVIKHAVKYMEDIGKFYDVVIDLDVTSPMRNTEDIDNAYRKLIESNLDIVYSVCEARKNPYFNMVELNEKEVPILCKIPNENVLSRQTAPRVYELNASIYVYKKDFLLSTNTIHSNNAGIYVMPQDRSVDIDTEVDFKFVEFMMNNSEK